MPSDSDETRETPLESGAVLDAQLASVVECHGSIDDEQLKSALVRVLEARREQSNASPIENKEPSLSAVSSLLSGSVTCGIVGAVTFSSPLVVGPAAAVAGALVLGSIALGLPYASRQLSEWKAIRGERRLEKERAHIEQLLSGNDQGAADALVKTRAKELKEDGDTEAAVELYRYFATQLLAKGNVGLAVDEYYQASSVYIAQRQLAAAAEMLKEARDKIGDRDQRLSQKLARHISMLDGPGTPESRLDELRQDFERLSEHGLAACCRYQVQ